MQHPNTFRVFFYLEVSQASIFLSVKGQLSLLTDAEVLMGSESDEVGGKYADLGIHSASLPEVALVSSNNYHK